MIKRIVEISQSQSRLSIKYGQLIIGQNGSERSIPCEDIGVLLVDHQGVIYTHCVFTELLSKGAAIVLCGANHHPTGMLLPLESNSVQTERFRFQIEVKEPVKKRLWKQIIQTKIKHQAKLLGKENKVYKSMMSLRSRVKSGDTSNIEAQASRKFWGSFFQEVISSGLIKDFKRDINGHGPNKLLNYGYMVARAAVARALCSAGLLPSLGLHHRNRYNAFCLADDIIEPFRGFVENKVREIYQSGDYEDELNQQIKAKLLEVLYEEVNIGGFKGPMMVGLHRTCASLVRVFKNEQKFIELPVL